MTTIDPASFLTLQEIVAAARRNLAPGPWAYLAGATESETTMRRNRQSLDAIAFRPRVLNDVSHVDSQIGPRAGQEIAARSRDDFLQGEEGGGVDGGHENIVRT